MAEHGLFPEIPESKTCTRCGVKQPLAEYFADKRRVGGLRTTCKSCANIYYKNWYDNNVEPVKQQWIRKRARIAGKPIPEPPASQACQRCKQSKPITFFRKNKRSPTGINQNCRKCCTEYGKEWREDKRDASRIIAKAAYWRNPEAGRRRARIGNFRKKYGLTVAEVDGMLIAQNNNCAICERSLLGKKANVDHDHSTGKIREILCTRCNLGIGYFEESSDIFFKCIEYLKRHGK